MSQGLLKRAAFDGITMVDDVFIVRKAERMTANRRQEYKTAKDRQSHRKEYEKHINASRFFPDVFQRMIDRIQAAVNDTDPDEDKVLKQGHF